MKKVLWVVTLFMLVAGGTVFAETYTLQQCIEMAKQTDPDLTRFRNAVTTANADLWYRAGQFLPSLSISGSYNRTNSGPTSMQVRELGIGYADTVPALPAITYKNYSAGFSVDYVIFDGLADIWSYLSGRASKRGAKYSFTKASSDLALLVKGEYYFVLKSRRDLEVAQEAVKRSRELLKLFEEKYELGSASLSEVLKQKVQYGNDQLTLVRADKIYKVAVDNLALTIGLSPNTQLEVAELDLRKEKVRELPDLVREALDFHPSLMSVGESVSALKYNLRSALGSYLPKVYMQYGYGWAKNTFNEIKKLGPYDHSGNISIGISLNIFDRFSRCRNISYAKAELNNARASEVYTKNRVVKDIRDAYLGIKLAEETLKVTEETEQAASEDMDLVQAKYNLGAAALWELLDAQVSLKSASFEKVKAEFDYNLALAKLKNAMGE